MAKQPFPLDGTRRKAILVLQQHDVERCGYERGAARALLDEEAYILQFPFEVDGTAPAALQNIVAAGIGRPGHVLVQSPYDADSYEDATVAVERFAVAKHMYFSTLCMHLGAKEVTVEQIDLKTKHGRTTFDLKAERLGAGAKVDVNLDEYEKLRQQMHLHDEFEGGPPDLAAAEQLLRRTGLWGDTTMRTLLDMRRDGTNRLSSRKLVLALTSEAKSNLNVVARLAIPKFIKLTAEYDRVVKEQHDYTLTVVVRF